MKVSLATQIFSRTCASAIKTMEQTEQFVGAEEDARNTATFLLKIDILFDGLNSKSLNNKNPN